MPTEQEYAAAVQAHLDAAAQARGYDDIRSAVSYAEEPEVFAFMEEGRLFRRWRSKVWATCIARQAAGAAGSVEDLIAALPPLNDADAPSGEAPSEE
jgi:hypothetical protein